MTERHELEPFVQEWLHRTLDTIPEPAHRYGLVAAEVNATPQARVWRQVPLPAGFSMWSVAKSFVAISIVALFGGFLLAGVLTGPQGDELVPADEVESPAPVNGAMPVFPTGTFVAEGDGPTLEFRTDGTCQREGVPCTFGVNGRFFSETTFEEPVGAQVPATYYWEWDGEQLTFEAWGTDKRPNRGSVYGDHVYHPAGEVLPLPTTASEFPIGQFVAIDEESRGLTFRENGRWLASSPAGGASGSYVVNGNLYTEMRHSDSSGAKVPATYRWSWDGDRLTFILWGEDADAWRKSFYAEHAYVRAEPPAGPLRSLLLSHPQLDVWVRVEISERPGGGYTAIATEDGEPRGEGVGRSQRDAVHAALEFLGEPYASDMVASVSGVVDQGTD